MQVDHALSSVAWHHHLLFKKEMTWHLVFLQVVIDAFRLINANMMVLGHEPRQTTSNLGHLNKPSIQVMPVFDNVLKLFYILNACYKWPF